MATYITNDTILFGEPILKNFIVKCASGEATLGMGDLIGSFPDNMRARMVNLNSSVKILTPCT